MICARYYNYPICVNTCAITVICITEFPHKQYTYRVPDMCIIIEYHTHILQIYYTYRVPDMYPLASILTSVGGVFYLINYLFICFF